MNKALIVGLSLSLASVSMQAAVNVSDGDVTGGSSYVFTVNADTFTNGSSMADKTNNAITSSPNVQFLQEAGGPRYFMPDPGSTNASFVMQWDFSGSNYRPTSVDLTNNMFMLAGQTADSTYTLETSTDGINYTPLASLTADGNHQTYSPATNTVAILGVVDSFYQRITFESPAPGSVYVGSRWGQVEDALASTQVFAADFSVSAIPEPSYSMLFGLCGIIAVCRSQRRRR